MYVILCYDIGVKRVARVRKTVKKYLRPIQKSVMTGNLTERSLGRLKAELEPLIEPEHDSITVFCCDSSSLLTKHQIGLAGPDDVNIL